MGWRLAARGGGVFGGGMSRREAGTLHTSTCTSTTSLTPGRRFVRCRERCTSIAAGRGEDGCAPKLKETFVLVLAAAAGSPAPLALALLALLLLAPSPRRPRPLRLLSFGKSGMSDCALRTLLPGSACALRTP